MMLEKNTPIVFWSRCGKNGKNFGDWITNYIFTKIKNKRSIWCDKKNLKSRFILGVEAWWIDKTPENEAKLHPALIVWGANDYIFPESGAHLYERDLIDVEKHILDTGHFALENNLDFIAEKISSFLNSRLQ